MTSAVYDVAYVGSVAVPRATVTSRLGTLQRPLLDLYVTYMSKSSKSRQLPQRRLTLTDRGIIISAIGSVSAARGRADNDAFYAVPSVIFWEAVRSVSIHFHLALTNALDRRTRNLYEKLAPKTRTKNLHQIFDASFSYKKLASTDAGGLRPPRVSNQCA